GDDAGRRGCLGPDHHRLGAAAPAFPGGMHPRLLQQRRPALAARGAQRLLRRRLDRIHQDAGGLAQGRRTERAGAAGLSPAQSDSPIWMAIIASAKLQKPAIDAASQNAKPEQSLARNEFAAFSNSTLGPATV